MVSGSGTNLQSILDAVAAGELPLDIAAVGADKPCLGIERAQAAGVPTFLVQPGDYADRPSWNRALEEKIASYDPDYIVFAGFMRIVDAQLVERFSNRIINTHPAAVHLPLRGTRVPQRNVCGRRGLSSAHSAAKNLVGGISCQIQHRGIQRRGIQREMRWSARAGGAPAP